MWLLVRKNAGPMSELSEIWRDLGSENEIIEMQADSYDYAKIPERC